MLDEQARQWSLPMELVKREITRPRAKGFEYADIVVRTRYTHHDCPEGRLWRAEQRKREQAIYAIRQDAARRTDEAWVEALTRTCPKCGEPSRERCINLSDKKRGVDPPRETVWPHTERLPEGWGT